MKKISIISFIVFLIDRIIKMLIETFLKLGVRNSMVKKFFYLTYVKNEGAAFSIFNGKIIFLILLSFVALYLVYSFIKKEKNMNNITIISYGMFIGGIIGNLIDRIFYGYVIDYLDFELFGNRFAIFNFADSMIVIGAILLLIFEGSDKNGKKDNS